MRLYQQPYGLWHAQKNKQNKFEFEEKQTD
jgi:hypothetical protein